MPSDLVSFSISTGLGASVLAGLISGVCYILVNRRSKNKPDRKWHCNVCGKYLRTVERVLHKEDFVVCIKCGGKTCKPKCCIQEPASGWICRTCHAQSNGWFKGMQKIMQPLTRALYTNTIMNEGTINEIDEDLDKLRNKEKEQVRDFIERLINNMLGGNVDDASVDNMYNDSHYLPILGQSPCSSHALLKQLVHCLIREASTLPTLEVQQNSNSLIDETSRTYEDLLATAILNKVISNAQNNLPSSSANSVSSRRSTSSRDQVHNFSFGEETIDSKWKTTDIDNTSVSSLEEWVQTDSSLGSTKYVDKLSLTIHQRIEEVSSTDSDDEEQDLEYMRANSAFSNDEPNWFLQRKPFQGNNSPVPVPMLVPNPTSEAKVLIGDQEIDDTSDLSDAASDFENMDTSIGIENHLIDSKSIIGGKTIFSDLNFQITSVSDDEISADSGVKEGKDFDEIDQDYLIARTECIPTRDMIDASLSSINSNTEKDTEYTESYASLPRTILKKHTSSKSSNADIEYPKNFENSNCDRIDNSDEEEENNNDAIFPGNYSKKEKEKWKHTVEMKYNPYSRENIEKRIKKTSNSMDKIFGSDYYVRQASLPSGARGTSIAEENSSFIFHNSTSPSIEDHEEKYSNDFVPALEQYSEDIYVATPVKVEDMEYMNSSIHDDYSKPEISEEENVENIDVTSDSDLSQINYYDVIESKVYAKFSNVDSLVVRNEPEIQDRDVKLKVNNSIDRHEVSVPVAKPRNKIVIKTIDKEIEHTKDYVDTTDELTKNYVPDTKYNSERIKVPTPSFSSTPFIIQKRSDNTLIKKIYANVNVRSFALNNRSTLPGTIDLAETEIEANERTFGHNSRRKNIKIVDVKPKYSQVSLPSPQLVLPNIYLDDEKVKSFAKLESNGSEVVRSDIKVDPPMKRDKRIGENEISELKAQGLVANRLRQLSKSMTNLTSVGSNKLHKKESLETTQNQCFTFSDDDLELNPRFNSVKYLRQRFEQQRVESVADKPIYSLTGRSISNQFKEKLRRMDNGFSIESEVHSLSLTNMDFDDKEAESRYEKTK